MKLSFKKKPQQKGLARIGCPYSDVDLKANGHVFGSIVAPNYATKDGMWGISFAVKDGDSFVYKHLKKRFESEKQARDFMKGCWEQFYHKYDIFLFEE